METTKIILWIALQIQTLAPQASMDLKLGLAEAIEQHCDDHHQDYAVSIAFVESSFNPNAVSKEGDIGLYQYNPHFHKNIQVGTPLDEQVARYCADLRLLERSFARSAGAAYPFYHHSYRHSTQRAYKARVMRVLCKIGSERCERSR